MKLPLIRTEFMLLSSGHQLINERPCQSCCVKQYLNIVIHLHYHLTADGNF